MVSVSLQARSKGMSTAVGWEINGAQANLDHPHQANPDGPSEYILDSIHERASDPPPPLSANLGETRIE